MLSHNFTSSLVVQYIYSFMFKDEIFNYNFVDKIQHYNIRRTNVHIHNDKQAYIIINTSIFLVIIYK